MRNLYLIIPPDYSSAGPHWGRPRSMGAAATARWAERLRRRRGDVRRLPPLETHYAAAIAEQVGVGVCLLDAGLERWMARDAIEQIAASLPFARPENEIWVGVLVSASSLMHDLSFAKRLKVFRPDTRVFLYGSVIRSGVEHWKDEARGVDGIVMGDLTELIGPMLAAPGDKWKYLHGIIDPNRHTGKPSEHRRPVGWPACLVRTGRM